MLVVRLGERLRERGWLLASAESCTGGGLGEVLTAVAGSSAWYERGFITYSNAAKRELLGVPAGALERYGAVSEPVARAMAAGTLGHSPAQLAVAITGIAGPGGGSPDKPVGTVCFGWAVRGGAVDAETRQFDGDRASVRGQSLIVALEGLLIRAA